MAEYLLFLRNVRKLSAGSIASHLSAIASVLKINKNAKTSSTPAISNILKSFRLEDQKKKFRLPAWDLGVVLRFLSSSRLEPLEGASFEDQTLKTVFLISLASAARVSEVHALDVSQVTFDRTPHGSAHLGLCLDFIAKNQQFQQPDRVFHLPALSSILGHQDLEDLSLCPVRALHIYLEAARHRRRGQRHSIA